MKSIPKPIKYFALGICYLLLFFIGTLFLYSISKLHFIFAQIYVILFLIVLIVFNPLELGSKFVLLVKKLIKIRQPDSLLILILGLVGIGTLFILSYDVLLLFGIIDPIELVQSHNFNCDKIEESYAFCSFNIIIKNRMSWGTLFDLTGDVGIVYNTTFINSTMYKVPSVIRIISNSYLEPGGIISINIPIKTEYFRQQIPINISYYVSFPFHPISKNIIIKQIEIPQFDFDEEGILSVVSGNIISVCYGNPILCDIQLELNSYWRNIIPNYT